MKKQERDYEFHVQLVLIVVLVAMLIVSFNPISASSVIPQGVPKVYGEELGIMYDDVSPINPQLADKTISLLGNIDKIETLTDSNLERYIEILYNMHGGMSCEYCCGAQSIIFPNGDMACGCAHSYAMRGLTKYLILNHPEMSDEEILIEIGKWKVLFFPGILEGKAEVLRDSGFDTDYLSLTTNKYRDIEKGQTSGGMIGSC